MRNASPIFDGDDRTTYDKFGYMPAVRAGPFVYIAGVVGLDDEGKPIDDPVEEYRAIFRTTERLLQAAGTTMADVITLDSFHVTNDLMSEIPLFLQARTEFMEPHPSWTAVSVSGLAVPGARAEVKATAFLGFQAG